MGVCTIIIKMRFLSVLLLALGMGACSVRGCLVPLKVGQQCGGTAVCLDARLGSKAKCRSGNGPWSDACCPSGNSCQRVASDYWSCKKQATPAPMALPAWARTALDMHNQLRAPHRAPSMRWNTALVDSARSWLSRCAFAHDPVSPYGENLYMEYGNVDATVAIRNAMQLWYDEVRYVDWSNPSWTSGTGHVLQLLWKGSKELGCAVQQCQGSTLVSCRYSPRGNVLGQERANVSPAF